MLNSMFVICIIQPDVKRRMKTRNYFIITIPTNLYIWGGQRIGQNIIAYGVSSNDINDEITTGKKAEEKPACFTVNAVVYQYENVYVCDVDSKIILAVEVVR